MAWHVTRVSLFALSFFIAYNTLGRHAVPPADTPVVRSILVSPRLIRQVGPEYPALAQRAHIRGLVVVELHISPTGHVNSTRVISGHPLLRQAAVRAVRQWIYEPFTFGGDPIEIVTTAVVIFPPMTTDRSKRTLPIPHLTFGSLLTT
jgi:TonB family protein